jgi:hypothetical protein
MKRKIGRKLPGKDDIGYAGRPYFLKRTILVSGPAAFTAPPQIGYLVALAGNCHSVPLGVSVRGIRDPSPAATLASPASTSLAMAVREAPSV